MKRKILSLLIVTLCLTLVQVSTYGQKKGTNKTKKTEKTAPVTLEVKAPIVDPVIMKINNEPVTKSEFLAIFMKNNNIKENSIDANSINEYLDLYINFRLKVKEAEFLKLDTSSILLNELSGYRKQLAQPYLVDKDINEALLNEAYLRSANDVRASHILIKVGKDAKPKDTLAAYNKILNIRKRIIAGEDFGKVAGETSEDPSARDQEASNGRPAYKGNKGDLGYFSAFDMVYPFENAAYNTQLGQISNIFRSDFGYHILKIADKKPALGKIHAAHLLVTYPRDAKAIDSLNVIKKIDEIKAKIAKGESFEELVKQYSDDKGSAEKGGALPWFTSNRMLPEFVSTIYKLEKDQISEPVATTYGWHFIKLLETKKPGTFDEMKADLKMRIARDVRSNKSKDSFIQRLKNEYSFKEMTKVIEDYIPIIDSSFNQGLWTSEKASKLNKPMFILDNKTYTQTDFTSYLSKNQGDNKNEEILSVLKNRYKTWIEEVIMNYEDNRLETKYPEFKNLIKEYRDGILLFDLTDKKVWTKAIKDSIGLQNYYDRIKNNYKYANRADAVIYKTTDKKTAEKALKAIKKGISKNIAPEEIIKPFNAKTKDIISIESGKYSKGDNKIIDNIEWKSSVSEIIVNDKNEFIIVVINSILEPSPKPITEIKGIVISEYQNYLEKEWIKELREKYTVTVDQEVVKSIK